MHSREGQILEGGVTQRIAVPDGFVDFPDDMSDSQIQAVLQREYPPAKTAAAAASAALPGGLTVAPIQPPAVSMEPQGLIPTLARAVLPARRSVSAVPALRAATAPQPTVGPTAGAPTVEGTGTIHAAPEPGVLEKLENVVLGSSKSGETPIGRAVGIRHFGPAAPEQPPTELPMLRPEAAYEEPGAIHGALKFAGGLTTPENAAIMVGTEGLGLAGPAAETAQRLISAGFSYQMLKGAIEQSPAFVAALKKGDYATAREIGAQMLLAGGAAFAGLKHAAGDITGEKIGRITPEQGNEYLASPEMSAEPELSAAQPAPESTAPEPALSLLRASRKRASVPQEAPAATLPSETSAESAAAPRAETVAQPSPSQTPIRADVMTPEIQHNLEQLTPPEAAGMASAVEKSPQLSLEGKAERLAVLAPQAPAPGEVGIMPTADIEADPHRFQYKLDTDASGTSTLLKEQDRFNPDLGGVITVWQDPADGQTYVINGHHRLELAKRTGEPYVAVRHIAADDAQEARATGALQNIAEGRGTPVDAAKFLRDTGITPEELKAQGISMGEATAREGIALARLDDSLFQKVVSGEMRPKRGVAIGEATADPAEQRAIADLIAKRERSGKHVNDDTLRELVRLAKSSGQTSETTASLFGPEEVRRSLALEKAEVSAYVKDQLSRDRRLFGFVAKEGRAQELQRGGNRIDVETSRRISTEAQQAGEVYDKLSERAGPVADVLDQASRRLAEGDNPAHVKQEAYQQIRAAVAEALRGRETPSPAGSGEAAARGTGLETEAAPGVEPGRRLSFTVTTDKNPQGRTVYGIEAFDGARNAGRIHLERVGNSLHVSWVELEDAYRGKGYARQLYQRAAELAREQGFSKLKSDPRAMSTPSAQRVWDGFVREGVARRVGDRYEMPLRRPAENASVPSFLRAGKTAPAPPATDTVLPHMEQAVAEHKAAAAEEQGRQLTREIAAPPESVSRAAGEMERESPLFRDSEASGQEGLFGDERGFATPELLTAGALNKANLPEVLEHFAGISSQQRLTAESRGIVRENLAELARKRRIAEVAMASESKRMDRLPLAQKYDFINRMERGVRQADPRNQLLADTLRRMLDAKRDEVQRLGTGALTNFVENYFPHIWDRPGQAARIFGRRPLEGNKGFLKRRSIPTFEEGVKAGLAPVTDNPVDLALLKLHEMDRYVFARKILAEYKARGLAQFVRFGEQPPSGYARIDDPISRSLQYSEPEGGFILRGEYWAPEPAARTINRYLSPSLPETLGRAGFKKLAAGYELVRGVGNTLNQAQLGLSGFHGVFTAVDSMTSDTALAIERAISGHPLKAAMPLLRAVTFTSPIDTYLKGSTVLAEYERPGSQGAEVGAITDALVKAGGRTQMDAFYKSDAVRNFWKAFERRSPSVAWRWLPAAFEYASRPLMEHVVPRMKLGVFHNLAQLELERLGPKADDLQLREALGRSWDSVDNRMGQLVYDNLFWNRAAKDLGMVSVRSLGWNIGTVRELGGGALDVARQPLRAVLGEKVQLTHRAAYGIALPITAGWIGGVIMYLATGQTPQELKDYFFPRTGRVLPNGEPERFNIPSYVKDVLETAKDPVRTVAGKLHPLVHATVDFLENKDFEGREIRNPEDPLLRQFAEVLGFAGRQLLPISTRNAVRQSEAGASHGRQALSFLGLNPAPREITRTKAETLALELGQRGPETPLTAEQYDRRQQSRQLLQQLRNGSIAPRDVFSAVKAGKITQRDARRILENKNRPPLVSMFQRLTLEDALKVWNVATPTEKLQLRQALLAKLPSIENQLPAKRRQLLGQVRAVLKQVRQLH